MTTDQLLRLCEALLEHKYDFMDSYYSENSSGEREAYSYVDDKQFRRVFCECVDQILGGGR